MYAKYTVHLKTLLEDTGTKEAINKALSTYPLYVKKSKEEYIPSYIPTREELNEKILNHYKYREIGFETPGRFIEELEISMKEIMPRYNLLFLTADQDFNMLYNADYTRHIERTKSDESSNTGKTTSETQSNHTNESTGSNTVQGSDTATVNSNTDTNEKKVHSETPQDQLSITANNIDNVNYADDVNWNKNTSNIESTTAGSNTATSNSESNSTDTSSGSGETNIEGTTEGKEDEDTLETVKGNYGMVSYQSLIRQYRELIVNIEQMIISDRRIKELFMQVF